MAMDENLNKTQIDIARMEQNCVNQTTAIFKKLDEMNMKMDSLYAKMDRLYDNAASRTQVHELKQDLEKVNTDHETRLRKIESDKKSITAITSSISTLVGILVYAIYKEIK